MPRTVLTRLYVGARRQGKNHYLRQFRGAYGAGLRQAARSCRLEADAVDSAWSSVQPPHTGERLANMLRRKAEEFEAAAKVVTDD